ncbi:MAG TPA: hypothetical protein PK843_02595 [bacterium]|nr:hypothetical protein [bacterium]
MEKRYPYRTSAPILASIVLFLGVATTCIFLILPNTNGHHITLLTAIIAGLSVSTVSLGLTLTMRALRPAFLTLRDDGIYFPGRPKEGWRISFTDIEEIHVQPPFLGHRIIAIKAMERSGLSNERWWSISERMLPSSDAFN